MKIRIKNKNLLKKYKAIIIFIVAGFFIFLFVFLNPKIKNNLKLTENLKCVTSVEDKIVRGDSLKGIVESGQFIKALFGYYQCNAPKREDVVLVDYAGDMNPIIKIVKGVPGDAFSVEKVSSGWNIIINGKKLKNSEGKEYIIDERKSKMISLYIESYNGKIPDDAFLVMGNLVEGSIDSTKFGLISRNDIIVKVENK